MVKNDALPTPTMGDAAWLAARRQVLTATDSPAILGVHPWKSALQVYVEKTQAVELTPMNERMRWGQLLEPALAAAYQEETGRQVQMPPCRLSIHTSIPWMGASLDRLVLDPERGQGVLELKTTAANVTRELPIHWEVQVAHQMEVAGADWGSIAVLIGGQRFTWFDLERNDRFVRALMRKLHAFWTDHVLARVPPPVDGSESCAKALAVLHASSREETVELPADSADWARKYFEAQIELRRWDTQKAEAQNALCAAMGAATMAIASDGSRFSWRPERRRGGGGGQGKEIRVFRVVQGGTR